MAATLTARRLTEAHRIAQARLGARTVQQLLAVWQLLDPTDLDGTVDRWLTATVPIIQGQRSASTRLAAGYLQAFRTAELGIGAPPFAPVLADAAPVEQVVTSLTVTGPVALKRSATVLVPLERAAANAAAQSAGAGMRHALGGGRDTIERTVAADPRALGWARATSGRACAFCRMLASRGPVYKGRDTAGFHPHDSCSCSPEPIYREDADWPPGSREAAAEWRDATTGERDQMNAFRRAQEADPEFRDARNARRRDLYRQQRAAAGDTTAAP